MAQTKQQREVIVLLVLLGVAALVWRFYFGKDHIIAGGLSPTKQYEPLNVVDYSPVFGDLEKARQTEYKSSGRNIFIAGPAPVMQTTPGAPVQVHKSNFQPQGPFQPPEPPPPQLKWKFYGVGLLPTYGPRRAFLLDKDNNDEVHIVVEGDTVENHIRITHIGNDRIEYEDTITGKKNSSPLELPPPA
jgi:hypothetical protein